MKVHYTIEYTDDGLAERIVELFSELFPGLSPIPLMNTLNFMAETIRVQRFQLASARGEQAVLRPALTDASAARNLESRGF